jgi:hypothetical protein
MFNDIVKEDIKHGKRVQREHEFKGRLLDKDPNLSSSFK